MPDADAAGKTQSTSGAADASSSAHDMRSLANTFNLLARYGDEYMDESPLMGEPGSFILSRTGDADRDATSKQQQPASTSVPGRVGTPLARVDTPSRLSDRSSAAEEPKLRKKKSRPAS